MYLGFLLNLEKSVVEPTQKITFLGFKLNTKTRTVSIPDDKLQGITQHCKSLLGQQSISIRAVAKVVGRLQATRLAITPGPLYYRGLQRLLPREQVTNWEVKVSLSTHTRADLTWWIQNAQYCNTAAMDTPHHDLVLTTDASMTGWGATCGSQVAQDFWSPLERNSHINQLELQAILNGLHALVPHKRNLCILVVSDNMVALSYLRKKGGT